MTRIKTLVLAVVAVFAMGALAASAANAGTFETEGGIGNFFSAGSTNTHVFEIDGTTVECFADLETTGLTENGASSVVVHPRYHACDGFGFLEATVTSTGCNYTLSAPGSESSMTWAGTVVLSCSGTNKIVMTAATCTATIASQTINSKITLENTTVSPMDIMITFANAPLTVVKTNDGFLCPLSGTGTTTGVYRGQTTSSSGFTLK